MTSADPGTPDWLRARAHLDVGNHNMTVVPLSDALVALQACEQQVIERAVLVPPEIEKLRDCATRPDGGSLTQFEPFIPLADAEAAVLACEKRMSEAQHAVASRWPILAQWAAGGTIEAHELVTDLRDALDFLGGENAGVWPDQSAQHAVLLDEIRECRQRTVAEIVEALREQAAAAFASVAGDYAEGQEIGWIDAVDFIEQRFGAKEEDDGE